METNCFGRGVLKKEECSASRIDEIDYYQLSIEVLRDIRGNMPQRELSSKLGYSFNQVAKWESGNKQIKWDDFIEVCKSVNIPVEDKLRYYFTGYNGDFNQFDLMEFLTVFLALKKEGDRRISNAVNKCKRRSGMLDLAELFAVLDSRNHMLIGFLSHFVDCSKLPLVSDHFESFLFQVKALSSDPNVGFVNEALKVKEYLELESHSDEVLARHACCSVEQLERTLKAQIQFGAITFDGKKYHPSPFGYSFAHLLSNELRDFNKYVFSLVAKKFPRSDQSMDRSHSVNLSRSSNFVVAMSKEASEKVERLVANFHSEVGQIVQEDRASKDNVQIISVTSVNSVIKPI